MINKFYRQARFLTSAPKLQQSPPDIGFEVAFAGRSNAGKSSAINRLCDQKALARTSKTPGRTQLLNFFALDDDRRLVDLPGYGYAKVSVSLKREWQGNLSHYLEHRECLRGLVLLMDIRHPLKDFDLQMLNWADGIGLPVQVVLTKADKFKRGAASAAVLQVRKKLGEINPEFQVQPFSALKGLGLAELCSFLDRCLDTGSSHV